MIDRLLSPALKASKKSTLLLGPRQVGKSTLIKSFKIDLSINFSDENVYGVAS
jgi:predicted AAA+ superfamily ATPase